jgi:hypothetical protein
MKNSLPVAARNWKQKVRRMRCEQSQHELGSLLGSQISGVIAVHELLVASQGLSRISSTTGFGHKDGPLVVAVQGQQGVV